MKYPPDFGNIQSLALDNSKTNEKLVIKLIGEREMSISRNSIGANEEWIEKMTKYEEYPKYRNITTEFSS
jgi:hypothetical protein